MTHSSSPHNAENTAAESRQGRRFEAAHRIIERYAGPAPRYTSYPTAPHFRADFSDDELGAVKDAWAGADAPLALYSHIPFCEKRCLYCGCHVRISRKRELGTAYVGTVLCELDNLAKLTRFERPLELLALGGGTPTWLDPADMRALIDGISARTSISDDREWSIEVDPRSVDTDYMKLLLDLGFNRFSFGVQDLNPEVMKAVGRAQGESEVRAAVAAVDGTPVNIDLMYGLPLQTVDSLRQTIDAVLTMAPGRLALFGYAHVPWLKKHQTALERHGLPTDADRLELYLSARARLLDAGYVPIGIDHFARPDDELAVAASNGTLHRNFMGYTTRPHLDLVATGVSGISQVNGTFAANLREVKPWREAVESGNSAWERILRTTKEDALRSDVIMSLMGQFSVNKQTINRDFDIDFDAHFGEERKALQAFAREGLLIETEEEIRLTELGLLIVRNVATVFDQWLGKTPARYSRTV